MNKDLNITLTGNLGSGKSSVCKELKAMGFDIISGGDIFRSVAADKGLTVIEMNELAKTDRSIDDLIDARSTRLGDELKHTVFDSRLAWHFVRKSFKVFLMVDTEEAARRVFSGENRSREEYTSIEDTKKGLTERAGLERDRFRNLYGIDYFDASNYDLVLESTYATPVQLAEEIVRNYEMFVKEPFSTKVEMNLKNAVIPSNNDGSDPNMVSEYLKQEKANKTLCSQYPQVLTVKNDFYYITGYAEALKAAAKTDKVFVTIDSFPAEQPEGGAYSVDFSKLA